MLFKGNFSNSQSYVAYLNYWDLHLKDIMFFAVRKYESVQSLNSEAVSLVGHVLA